MKIPARLLPLLDVGIIDDVIRPLMSGKEAAVYLVEARGELRVAKVYKDAQKRSFKHRADYTEGRKVRNSRRQRAMEKRSKFGRGEMEAAWRTAEVDAIRRLRAAGVTVPEPFEFYEGVLVMELIEGEPGMPAPRLIDVTLRPSEARSIHRTLLAEIIKMLCAGVVHGDLSDFNVLMRASGPVIIDFPQAVDPSFNNNAKRLFIRDVDNISSFLARFAPELGHMRYGKEIWGLYEKGVLDPEVELTGTFTDTRREANVGAILDEIDAARDEAMRRLGERPPEREERPRGRRGEPPPTAVEMAAEGAPRRRSVFVPTPPPKKNAPKKKGAGRRRDDGPRGRGGPGGPRRGRGPDGPRGERPPEEGQRRSRSRPRRGDGGPPRRDDGPQRNDGPPRRGDGPPRRGDGPPRRGDGPPAHARDRAPEDAPKKKRRRRRRKRRPGGGGGSDSASG